MRVSLERYHFAALVFYNRFFSRLKRQTAFFYFTLRDLPPKASSVQKCLTCCKNAKTLHFGIEKPHESALLVKTYSDRKCVRTLFYGYRRDVFLFPKHCADKSVYSNGEQYDSHN